MAGTPRRAPYVTRLYAGYQVKFSEVRRTGRTRVVRQKSKHFADSEFGARAFARAVAWRDLEGPRFYGRAGWRSRLARQRARAI